MGLFSSAEGVAKLCDSLDVAAAIESDPTLLLFVRTSATRILGSVGHKHLCVDRGEQGLLLISS